MKAHPPARYQQVPVVQHGVDFGIGLSVAEVYGGDESQTCRTLATR
jgi:hypothetical protein